MSAAAASSGKQEEDDETTNIWTACVDGELAVVKKLMATDRALTGNVQDENGFSPLMAAATSGNIALCKWLLVEKKADPKLGDNDGDTALHHCAVSVGTPEIINLLIDSGADVNKKNKEGCTPLDLAEEELKQCKEDEDEDDESVKRAQKAVNTLAARGGVKAQFGKRREQDDEDDD